MDALARLGVDPSAIRAVGHRNGVSRLAVFASALRRDFTSESDVDPLVEFRPGQKVGIRCRTPGESRLLVRHDHAWTRSARRGARHGRI